MCFISMHSVSNILSENTYFYISKNITRYTFLLVFKVVKSLQRTLNVEEVESIIYSISYNTLIPILFGKCNDTQVCNLIKVIKIYLHNWYHLDSICDNNDRNYDSKNSESIYLYAEFHENPLDA